MYAFDSPTKRNQMSMVNMIWNDAYLSVQDLDYIRHIDDLITLQADTDTSWVHNIVKLLFKCAGDKVNRVGLHTETPAVNFGVIGH